MLVAVDASEVGSEVLPLAAMWTAALHLEPQVVNVIEPGARSLDAVRAEPGTETAVAQHAAGALAELTGRDVNWEVLSGDDVADNIVRHAEHTDATLIALTTHGRTGLSRLLMGSVAMSVVPRALSWSTGRCGCEPDLGLEQPHASVDQDHIDDGRRHVSRC